ncbi:hypothetical protein QK087_002118 [Enterococcus faecium]|nr:hypothetical protein [Enterococcus faecium]
MKLLSVIILPIAVLGFAHASVHISPHVSPHVSSHASVHSSPHVSSHAHSSSHPTEHATPSSKGSNHVAKENEASVKTSKKSNIHAPIVRTHHKQNKDKLSELKRQIKKLSKSDQHKMKEYIDKLVK